MEWIRLVLDVLILGVWLLYAQLFYKSWKSSRTPRLLIGVSSDSKEEDIVYLTNLSEKTIHIDEIQVRDSQNTCTNITALKYELENREKSGSLMENSYQGPLAPGSLREIRGLSQFLHRFSKKSGEVTVCALGVYSEEFRHVGFKRKLSYEKEEGRTRLKAKDSTQTIKAQFKSGIWESQL